MLLYAADGLGEGLKINGRFLIDRVATCDHSHVWSARWPFLLFPSVNWRTRVGEASSRWKDRSSEPSEGGPTSQGAAAAGDARRESART